MTASFKHLYVHVPFCARRCTYCDFSIAVRSTTPVDAFLSGIERELSHTGLPPRPTTVYLGGGTPSRLGGAGIARLASLLGVPGELAEFTIEANPEDVTAESVRDWVRAGVNRISIGAQSFDDGVLAWMHRTHSSRAIPRAVETARANGIGNVSVDLIFSLPETLKRDWTSDLARAIALEPDHVSLYGLTVESGTPLAKQILRGQGAAAPDSRYEEEYLRAHDMLGAAGFRFYEVSNASRPGREAIHNRAYWRRVPYLGIGPSAHSFDGSSRWWNEPAYAAWVAMLGRGESPVAERETLDQSQSDMEQLYLGLRTVEGIALDDPWRARLLHRMDQWVRSGWARVQAGRPNGPSTDRLCLSPQGWLRLDELVASV